MYQVPARSKLSWLYRRKLHCSYSIILTCKVQTQVKFSVGSHRRALNESLLFSYKWECLLSRLDETFGYIRCADKYPCYLSNHSRMRSEQGFFIYWFIDKCSYLNQMLQNEILSWKKPWLWSFLLLLAL